MKQCKQVVLERRKQIFELIYKQERISLDEICSLFRVSKATARRDINDLVEKNLVLRDHNGAIAVSKKDFEHCYQEKETRRLRKKQNIVRCLSNMLPEGSVLFCGGGSTVMEFFRQVKHRNLTIVSSNAKIFAEASDSDCRLICVGGEYNHLTQAFSSRLTPALMARYRIEYLVFGVDAFSAEYGGTSSSSSITNTNDILLGLHGKRKMIVVADGGKIGVNSCFPQIDIADVDWLVTDATANTEELRRIRDKGVEVFVAEECAED